jgi:hypothetical protein
MPGRCRGMVKNVDTRQHRFAYIGAVVATIIKFMSDTNDRWGRAESNRRRQPFQGCALPTELPPHFRSRLQKPRDSC